MICITERDKKIKEFLSDVGIADTRTISILFFSDTTIRNCQKRLKQLVDTKYIKVYRENVISQNIYYSNKKPKNIAHKIVFSRLLAELKQHDIEVLKYRCPFKVADVIADGLVVLKANDIVKIYFIEVERTKKLDTDKYIDLYYSRKWKEVFPVMPSILCISDKNINTGHNVLDIVQVKFNLEDLYKLRLEFI